MKTTYKFADDIEQSSSELVLIERLVAKAYAFYRDPKNEQAFQAWKKNKEALNNDSDNINP